MTPDKLRIDIIGIGMVAVPSVMPRSSPSRVGLPLPRLPQPPLPAS